MKEIYSTMGIEADKEVPQPTLKIERPLSVESPQPSTSMEKR